MKSVPRETERLKDTDREVDRSHLRGMCSTPRPPILDLVRECQTSRTIRETGDRTAAPARRQEGGSRRRPAPRCPSMTISHEGRKRRWRKAAHDTRDPGYAGRHDTSVERGKPASRRACIGRSYTYGSRRRTQAPHRPAPRRAPNHRTQPPVISTEAIERAWECAFPTQHEPATAAVMRPPPPAVTPTHRHRHRHPLPV